MKKTKKRMSPRLPLGRPRGSTSFDLERLQAKIKRQYPWLKTLDESSVITDNRQPNDPIIHVNDTFEQITRYPREVILGQNCRFLQGPLSDKKVVDLLRHSIADSKPVEVEIINYRRDGIPFLNCLLLLPVFASKNLKKASHYIGIQKDVTIFVQDETKVEDWSYFKLAMMLDKAGFTENSYYVIQNKLSGTEFLELINKGEYTNSQVDENIALRKELPKVAEWAKTYNEKMLKNASNNQRNPIYSTLDEEFGAFDENPNTNNPRNLEFWQQAKERAVQHIKCYFKDQIALIEISRRKVSYNDLIERLARVFGYLLEVRYQDNGNVFKIANDEDLKLLMRNTPGTLLLQADLQMDLLQECYKFQQILPLPIVYIDEKSVLSFRNEAAEKMFEKCPMTLSGLFKDVKEDKISSSINKSFSAQLAKDGKPVTITVSSTATNTYYLTILPTQQESPLK